MSARRRGGPTVGVLAALVLAFVATVATRARPEPSTCRLLELGSDLLRSEDCLVCHPRESCHPIEVVYREAWERRGPGGAWYLRPENVAVSRGAYLPEGRVRCVTCHDRHSKAGAHLAVPPTSAPAPSTERTVPLVDKGCSPLCLECHPWRD